MLACLFKKISWGISRPFQDKCIRLSASIPAALWIEAPSGGYPVPTFYGENFGLHTYTIGISLTGEGNQYWNNTVMGAADFGIYLKGTCTANQFYDNDFSGFVPYLCNAYLGGETSGNSVDFLLGDCAGFKCCDHGSGNTVQCNGTPMVCDCACAGENP